VKLPLEVDRSPLPGLFDMEIDSPGLPDSLAGRLSAGEWKPQNPDQTFGTLRRPRAKTSAFEIPKRGYRVSREACAKDPPAVRMVESVNHEQEWLVHRIPLSLTLGPSLEGSWRGDATGPGMAQP
jgi:hypothetical protein